VLLYPSAISLSTTHLRHVTDLLTAHLRRIGSPWRKLEPRRQALLVLAHLRNGDTYERLATGFGVGVAAACRYVHEVTDLLAAHAPTLTAAVWRLAWTHNNFAILDGTVVRIDRITADRPFYSGKHRHHGINLQGLTDPYAKPGLDLRRAPRLGQRHRRSPLPPHHRRLCPG
jgi:DDE superfamily endonuclease